MIELSAMFSDGAVFQHDREIKVFGKGQGKFSAEFLNEKRTVDANGDFSVTFSAHKAGGPYEMEVWLNDEEKVIKNIMIGEVILLAGQSNTVLTVGATDSKDLVFENNDNVRYFSNAQPGMNSEKTLIDPDTSTDKWHLLKTENSLQWSAIALHTALYYAEKLNMAVGIVMCSHGAANIQSFLSEEINAKFDLDKEKLHDDAREYKWNKNGYLYHWLVKKITPYTISKGIWYQGESNRTVYEGKSYDKMLIALIDMFRKDFLNPNLPFAVVQINDFPYSGSDDGVAAIQSAQERAVKQIDNCRLVKINDMGQYDNIHPTNKAQVAERICLALDEL